VNPLTSITYVDKSNTPLVDDIYRRTIKGYRLRTLSARISKKFNLNNTFAGFLAGCVGRSSLNVPADYLDWNQTSLFKIRNYMNISEFENRIGELGAAELRHYI
jgi:hypothetical protein